MIQETQKQKKVASIIQKDIVDILQKAAQEGMKGVIITVTKVHVTVDLSIAKVFLSVFPSEKRDAIVKGVSSNTPLIKHELAKRTKNQMRRVPELFFYADDSLDYIEGIDNALKGNVENPIENPEILPKRKKK